MIKLEHLSKYYHEENLVSRGIVDVSLEFKLGEFVAITGESGSGKSTLLNVIAGIDSYEEGELYINGEPTSAYDDEDWNNYRKSKIGFIFQNYHLIDSYTVYENIDAALVLNNVPLHERRQKVNDIIARVGLSEFKHTRSAKLSGGQKQRVAIARALAKDTQIIVADEPTGNLDVASGKAIVELLGEISKDKLVIVVSHNYPQIEPFATRKIRLTDGKLVEDRVLKKVPPVEVSEVPTVNKKQSHALYFAWKNFLKQPKRTTIMLLVTLFAVIFTSIGTANLFTSIQNFQSSMGLSYGSKFPNSSQTRLVAKRDDGGVWQEEDTKRIKAFSNVSSVMLLDELSDKTFPLMGLFPAAIPNGQYEYIYDEDMSEYYYPSSPFYREYYSELKIYKGRAPKAPGEFVLTYDYAKYFTNNVDWKIGKTNYYQTYSGVDYGELKLVGFVVKSGVDASSAFFSNDDLHKIYSNSRVSLIKNVWQYFTLNDKIEGNFSEAFYMESYDFYVDPSLTLGHVRLEAPTVEYLSNYDIIIARYPGNGEIEVIPDIEVSLKENSTLKTFVIYVSQADVDKYVPVPQNNQVSIYVSDPMFKKITKKQISNRGYRVIDIAGTVDPLTKLLLGFLSMFIIISFLIGQAFSALIVYFILRTILVNKMKDYAILTTIGLDRKDIKKVSFLELVIPFSISFLLSLLIFIVLRASVISPFITPILLNINIIVLLAILLITIGLSLIIAQLFFKYVKKKSLLSEIKGGSYL